MPRETTEPTDRDRPALRAEDRATYEVVEKAQEQYRTYLATSEIGSLARLTSPRPNDAPPRTDLPLTLTVS
jgi:hypothetical protein